MARLSTSALESCFRRVICRGMKEGKPPVLAAQVAFWVRVQSNDNVTEKRLFGQKIMLPGWPLLPSQ